jgi:hypothetical protein
MDNPPPYQKQITKKLNKRQEYLNLIYPKENESKYVRIMKSSYFGFRVSYIHNQLYRILQWNNLYILIPNGIDSRPYNKLARIINVPNQFWRVRTQNGKIYKGRSIYKLAKKFNIPYKMDDSGRPVLNFNCSLAKNEYNVGWYTLKELGF